MYNRIKSEQEKETKHVKYGQLNLKTKIILICKN